MSLYYRVKYKIKSIISKRFYKNILTFGNCQIVIEKDSNIVTSGFVSFNVPWEYDVFRKNEFGKIIIKRDSFCSFGKNIEFRSGCKLIAMPHSTLEIGDNVKINLNSTIYCYDSIYIGSGTRISENVIIRDSDVHFIDNKINSRKVYIGENVWLCTNVIILKGVKIGSGSIIGAGSVVTHDIPGNCIAAGNPCRVISSKAEWHL